MIDMWTLLFRWSIDETYSKSLVKLANKANSNTEKGTYAPIFGVLRQSSEKLSSIHSHTVQRVQDLVKEVVKYNDELHKKHKGVSAIQYKSRRKCKSYSCLRKSHPHYHSMQHQP